jgi:hypothetical protein
MSEHDELRKLAEEMEAEASRRTVMAETVLYRINQIISRYPNPPATDEEMREKVERLLILCKYPTNEWVDVPSDAKEKVRPYLMSILRILRPSPTVVVPREVFSEAIRQSDALAYRPSPASEPAIAREKVIAELAQQVRDLRGKSEQLREALHFLRCLVNRPDKLNIESARSWLDDNDAALTRPPQEEKPKPNSIAGDHTGMKWDGLSGNWYPIKEPPAVKRWKCKEGHTWSDEFPICPNCGDREGVVEE